MKRLAWGLIPLSIFLTLSLFLWRGLSLDPHYLPSAQLGHELPKSKFINLEKKGSYLRFKQMRGQIFLVNVWASWCQACTEEQAFLLEIAHQSVPIYGVNYKDKSSDALAWLEVWGNPYKHIIQDREGQLAIDLGVYGAPETFVIDKEGQIRYRHAGVLNKEIWLKEIQPLIKQL